MKKFHEPSKFHIGSYQTKITNLFLIFSKKNIISDKELKTDYHFDGINNFYDGNEHMFYTLKYNGNYYKMSNTYVKEFKAGYMTWKINKFFGGGIKSFVTNCGRANVPNCVTHPHNYYLEILAELGLFGLFLILAIFFIIIFKSFIKKYFTNSKLKQNYLIVPSIFLFLFEIFPFKNTGSFFSTQNATYLFLIMSILISLINRENLIEKKT